jgi:hypothetical protein
VHVGGLTSFFRFIVEINLGPISARLYSGNNWTHAELAFVSNRNGGMARRETAVSAGFKSDHLIDMVGKDNPADSFECPETGTLYFGKIVQTPTGVYAISAKDVYTKALYTKAVKQGLAAAESATTEKAAEPVTVTTEA